MANLPTARQIKALLLVAGKGWGYQKAAIEMKTTAAAIRGLVHRIKRNTEFMQLLGDFQTRHKRNKKVIRYANTMDYDIEEKF